MCRSHNSLAFLISGAVNGPLLICFFNNSLLVYRKIHAVVRNNFCSDEKRSTSISERLIVVAVDVSGVPCPT